MNKITGRIMKATGGFYYVESAGVLYECRARGAFRNQGISPMVGDMVEADTDGLTGGYVMQVLPRKNAMTRPPLANLDTFVLVASVCDPVPNPLVLDKMMAVAVHQGIRPVLVITKSDLGSTDTLVEIYRTAGLEVFVVSNETGAGVDALRAALAVGISAFSGNTGVGKSSLLNRLDERLALATGETSRKLGRGRHTTRTVELFRIDGGGIIADTPGFSAVDLERYDLIRKEELADCFPEFAEYTSDCRYTSCSHTVEKGCTLLEALAQGKIHPSRHTSYLAMYEDAKRHKDWETRGER